jgi:hypothetical protein
MTNTIQQLEDLKEWSQDSARYERRMNFRAGQLVQPRQGFYRKGFVKPNRLTKEEIDQRYKAKKLRENPEYKAEADRRWKAKKLRENPDWSAYKAGTHYKRRLEAKEKGLIYDKETKKFRKARKIFIKYNKFVEAGDKKIISGWKKSLTDAAKAGDMSETLGFKTYLTKKYGNKEAQTIRNRVRLQLKFAPGEVSDTIQENFIDSLVKKHNESDKALYSKKDIFDKVVIDRNLGRGREIYFNLDNRLENLDTKINKAFDKIVDNNLLIKASKKTTPHVATYSPITQMISEISGAGSNRTIQEALLKNPKFKDKEFVDTFKYLSRAHAKDLVGLPFDEAFEYAKMRQGGLDVKGLISYTTRYQNPESNIMNFAVRHANRHFRDGTKSQVQFYKLRADGTKGAPMPWDKLPKNRDGNRILDIKKVGFEYKDQFFHRNNLKTKGYKSGLFDEVYAMSGKNRLLVPDPENLSNKITLKKLLQTTGDKLTLGHDEALGGVKGSPFKNLKLQGNKLNTALFAAYDKIQNKDLRKRVLHSLEGQFKGLSGGDYEKAFIEGKVNEAKDIINKKIDVSKKGTLYREAGREIVTDPVFKTFSPKKQREAMRIAGDIKTNPAKFLKKIGYGRHCKASGGRVGFQEAGAVAGELTCVMDDVNKTKADMKSPDVEVRAKALTKQRKALQLASKIPTIGEILRRGLQMGTAALTAPLKALGFTSGIGYALEGLVEGGIYDYYRRQGYKHEQAFAETFTPGLIAGRPHDVPWYGGSEALREKELRKISGDSKVGQYIDALAEQDRIYETIGRKEELKGEPTTTDETLFIPGDLAAASADVQDLARSGAYRRVDQTLKPESMASQAYETAVERQLGLDLQRKKDYLEKVDPGALEREKRILSRPRQLEKRYEAMEEKYPTYTREQLEEVLRAWGTNTPWDAGFASGVKGYDEMGEWLKTHDKYKDMEAGVANRATGGLASLLKKK